MLLGALRQTRPRLAYVIPEFHNPTGHLMPAELRERLVATAHAAGTELVVDESFVDLPLDGAEMPPPVAVFDRHSRVVSIGGMSKAVLGWPADRLGPRLGPAGAAARRDPGRRRHGQPGAGAAGRRAPAAPTRRRSSAARRAAAALPARRAGRRAARAAAGVALLRARPAA